MPRLTLLAVGKLKDRSLADLCGGFAERVRRQAKLEVVEVRDGTMADEGARLLRALEKRRPDRVYALAEEGRMWRSVAFAEELGAPEGRSAAFVVGGAFGLAPEVKARADVCLSLSRMTFPHELARLLLLEQLYRALAIRAGSAYHHE